MSSAESHDHFAVIPPVSMNMSLNSTASTASDHVVQLDLTDIVERFSLSASDSNKCNNCIIYWRVLPPMQSLTLTLNSIAASTSASASSSASSGVNFRASAPTAQLPATDDSDNSPNPLPGASKPKTLTDLPTEIRQQILLLALSTLHPIKPENGDYIDSLHKSRVIRLKAIARLLKPPPSDPVPWNPYSDDTRFYIRPGINQASTPRSSTGGRFFTLSERRSYIEQHRLHLVNRMLRADMVGWVEHSWLTAHQRQRPALSLAAFAEWAANPTPVNGVLALSLFSRDLLAAEPLPARFEAAVRSLATDTTDLSDEGGVPARTYACTAYMAAWRSVVMALPAPAPSAHGRSLAREYSIEAVEVVDVQRRVRNGRTGEVGDANGWVVEWQLARLEILLLMKFGLGCGRVRVVRRSTRADMKGEPEMLFFERPLSIYGRPPSIVERPLSIVEQPPSVFEQN